MNGPQWICPTNRQKYANPNFVVFQQKGWYQPCPWESFRLFHVFIHIMPDERIMLAMWCETIHQFGHKSLWSISWPGKRRSTLGQIGIMSRQVWSFYHLWPVVQASTLFAKKCSFWYVFELCTVKKIYPRFIIPQHLWKDCSGHPCFESFLDSTE